jgi:hypothetical protein
MIKLANGKLRNAPVKAWLAIVLLLGFAGALYLPFRSVSLDDFDAYSFAMALEHFDLRLQQPQPPGFPLYVFLGRILLGLVREPVSALTTLSALSGVGCVLLVYGIGRTLVPQRRRVGVSAAVLFALVPMSWLTAEKALSDMPGLMGTLVALWLLWRGVNSSTLCLALGGLAAGLSLGVRPQNALPLLLLMVWILIRAWLERYPFLSLLWMGGGLGLGVLIWLLPTLYAVGGASTYLSLLMAHATHVGQADALMGMDMSLGEALYSRTMAFGDTFLSYTIGVELFGPWTWADTVRIAILFLVVGLALLAVMVHAYAYTARRREAVYSLVVWAGAMVAQVFLFETLDRPRLMLPILPPLALLITWGWALIGDAASLVAQQGLGDLVQQGLRFGSPKVSRPRRRASVRDLAQQGLGDLAQQDLGDRAQQGLRFGSPKVSRPRRLRAIAFCILALALLIQGAPLAARLALTPAPPAQACDYVAAHYAPDETLIATAGSFRAVQVELPEYPLFYLYRFDPASIQALLASDRIRYVVILDRDQFPASAVQVLSDQGRWVPLVERTFSRDRRVHTQHDQVRMQVLTPASLVPLTALTLPPDGCLDIGHEADGRYLGAGWFRPEIIGGVQGRWAGGILTSTVRLNLEATSGYRVRFRALAYPAEQTVDVYLEEGHLAHLHLPQSWTAFEIALPRQGVAVDRVSTLRLVHSRMRAPFEVTGGGSSDARKLSVAYDWLCVIPEPVDGG